MVAWQRHPGIPWIWYAELPDGVVARCVRTGDEALCYSTLEFSQFVANHSATPGHYGLGDAVRAATNAAGIAPCAPCAKRQSILNRIFPKLLRR